MIDTPRLVGRTVVLRALTLEDVPALARASAESRDTYLWSPVPDGVDGTQAYVEFALRQRAAGVRMPFVTEWNGRVVGTTSFYEMKSWEWPAGSPLQRKDVPDAVEVGYTWLSQSSQRTAVNTEAKYLMFRHAFEVWQVHGVFLKTDERNARSRAAIERVGARFEGIRRAHMPGADGAVRSSAYFSIVRDEWPAVRAMLEGKLG